MDGKRFTYISVSSRLTVWEAVGPWLERTGACWLVQQAPWDTKYLIYFFNEKRRQTMPLFPRIVEQTGSSFRNLIFEKALGASITCNLQGICIVRMIPKTIPKWIIILSKSHQNPGLEAPKSRSGGLWGRFGGVLGNLGPSWTFVEASWTVLEASWKRLGSLLGRFGPKKLANMAPRWLPKRRPNL